MRKAVGTCMVLLAMTACSTKRGYVEKGNVLFQQGKYEAAAINYRKAIQKDPNYGEAFYRLGLNEDAQGNPGEAYNALFRANQLLSTNTEVKEKFASFCLEYYLKDPSRPAKLYQQLQQTSEELVAHNPNSFEGLRVKGYLAYADRKPQDAIPYFRKALQVDPSSAPVTTALVQTLADSGQAQEGEKLALALLARRKDYGPIYDALYRVYSNLNRPADAEKVLETRVANNPKNAEYMTQLAAHYARVGKTAEMKTALQRIVGDSKDFHDPELIVGDFYLEQKNYADAVRYYQQGSQTHPSEKLVYEKRAMAAFLSDMKYEDAGRLVQQILKEDPKDEVALRVHADLLIIAGGAENGAAALALLQDQANKNPNDMNPSLRFQMGRAYRLKGDLDAARAQFSEALRMHRNYTQAQYELAEIALAQHRPDEALAQANSVLSANPGDRHGRLLRAQGLLATGDSVRAHDELTQLLKESPQDTEARYQLGSLAFQQKKYPEAIERLSGLVSTGDPRVFAALTATYARQGQIDKAVDIANQGLKRVPDSTLIREQLAEAAVYGGKFDLAISESKKLIASNPKSLQAYVRLGAIYDLKGDSAASIGVFQQAHDLAPNELGPALTLAQALAQAGRRPEALVVYQNILKVHPNDPTVLNNTAYFLCDSGGNLDDALRLAQSAVQKVPDQPSFADTLGYVYLKRGMRTSAIQTFSSLVRKYPKYATYHYHLGLALYETGNKTGAKKELHDALSAHPTRRDAIRINELLARAG
jgi:tetratricopeptide (TPR) repeat protein